MGVARIPDDLELPPAETLAYAQDLLDRGPGIQRARGVGGRTEKRPRRSADAVARPGPARCRHHPRSARGNVKGALTLLRRASAKLAHNEHPVPYTIDTAGLVAYAEALIDDLGADTKMTPKRPRPRLVASDS